MVSVVDERRVRLLNEKPVTAGPIVYWMSRDARVHDNWALLYAQQQARANNVPLIVVFCLVPTFLDATIRQYDFMLKGLAEVEETLASYRIPFVLLTGKPEQEVPVFCAQVRVGAVVTDADPLRTKQTWKKHVGKDIACALYEVDAHNIIPVWVASPKREFGAYTLRPKIRKLLPEFLQPFPHVKKQDVSWKKQKPIEWSKVIRSLRVNMDVPPVDWIFPGESAAKKTLHTFIHERLRGYDEKRNDPNEQGQSGLSPYLHFGQLSSQRIVLSVEESDAPAHDKETFLEELIVRRELSDNFCFYTPTYDSFEGFPEWAKQTLDRHRKDARPFVYTRHQFEQANTHDELWNAAQFEMVHTGKMHGYMRMYWAKKILEWTRAPEEALRIAIYLNDTYELDGRDPNGYTGIAWSIGGVHDRAWFERPIFGKIRYMNAAGCKRKFDIERYITIHHIYDNKT